MNRHNTCTINIHTSSNVKEGGTPQQLSFHGTYTVCGIRHLFETLVKAALNHSHSEFVEGTSDGSTGMGLVSRDTLISCAPRVSLSYSAHHSHGCRPRPCWDTPPNVSGRGRRNMAEVHTLNNNSLHSINVKLCMFI